MVAIIGDIHGCYYTLVELYTKIRKSYPDIPVYCVGDLVDRGNYSYEVMNFIIENKIWITPGNHDYMFYHFFKDPSSIFAKSWFFNGNETTLESYENRQAAMFDHIDFIKEAKSGIPNMFGTIMLAVNPSGYPASVRRSLAFSVLCLKRVCTSSGISSSGI